ncbi:MAG: TAXI family TRAP transporter solute-binding subunit [Chloroflexi bacterium]|nr:TAXI family TRAP transporter solute-binding subunit [Chloroflexota bacterium]
MKRGPCFLAFLTSVAVVALVGLLSACGGTAAPSTTQKPADTQAAQASKPAPQASGKPMTLTILGGSVGGMWSAITEGVAEAIRRGSPAGSSITPKPGKDGPNSVEVSNGQAEVAMAQNVSVLAALEGREPYKEKIPNLRSLAILNRQYPYAFVAMANLPINSVQELKDKKFPIRLSVNVKGSNIEMIAKEWLAAYGVTYDDIEKWGGKVIYQPTNDGFAMMKDGKIDAQVSSPQAGSSIFVEADRSMSLKVLAATKESGDFVMKRLGTFPATIKKGTYNFIKEDIVTFTPADMLIMRAELPEDDAYRIAKALVDNIDYLKSVHKALEELSPQFMADSGVLTLHPGAAKLYREKGGLK